MLNKLKSKKGATEILELIISFTVLTFIIFFPLATYNMNQRKNLIEDSKTIGIQMAARNGGVTTAVKNAILQDLSTKGFDTSQVVVKSNTSDTTKIYREDSTPISLELYVPAKGDITFIKAIWSLVGVGGNGFLGNSSSKYWYVSKGAVLSELPTP